MSRFRGLPIILMVLTVISMSKLCGCEELADRQFVYVRRKTFHDFFALIDKLGDYQHEPPTLHVKHAKLSSKTCTKADVLLQCLEDIIGFKFLPRRKKISKVAEGYIF